MIKITFDGCIMQHHASRLHPRHSWYSSLWGHIHLFGFCGDFHSITASNRHSSPIQFTPTFDSSRLAQPPTVVPPAQADNGAQVYWGMCMACHGDQGQGLTDEWRNSFRSKNATAGNLAVTRATRLKTVLRFPKQASLHWRELGTLSRFSNSFELYRHIHQNMPFFVRAR